MNRKDRRRNKAEIRARRGRGPANWPDFDPQALFKAAVADRKAGRLDAAEKGYRQILSVFPENAGVNVNLAIVLRELGRLEEAAECCRTAIESEPRLVQARIALGSLETELGRPDSALEQFDAALELEPGVPGTLVNRSIALRALRRFDEATQDCLSAIQQAPDMAEARNTLGAIQQAAGKLDDAERTYNEVLARFPKHAEALINLASLHNRRGRYDDAVGCCDEALAADPSFVEAHVNKGIARREQGRAEDAATAFGEALALDPTNAGARVNLGTAMAAMGRNTDALACYEDALTLAPGLAEAHLNRGNALRDLGRLTEGIASYRDALAHQPDSVDAHFNLALALLAAGDFEAGWREHEWRWKTEKLKPFSRDFDQPLWDGSPLGTKSLLVWNEQGIGDEVMFSLCLPDLLASNPEARILLECDGRLVGMLGRTYPNLTILGRDRFDTRGDFVARPQFDVHIPAGSLQQHYRGSLNAFPSVIIGLRPDAEKLARWRHRLDGIGTGLKVGIAWRGGVLQSLRQQKSIALETLIPVLTVAGIHFVNLQYGDCANELAAIERDCGVTIHDWPDLDPIADIEDQAALIANLDLVIQTSNASAHMAGAMDIPVWTLVCAAPDWRWGTTGDTCPWYPSMRIFRQRMPGDWKGLAEEIAGKLETKARGEGP